MQAVYRPAERKACVVSASTSRDAGGLPAREVSAHKYTQHQQQQQQVVHGWVHAWAQGCMSSRLHTFLLQTSCARAGCCIHVPWVMLRSLDRPPPVGWLMDTPMLLLCRLQSGAGCS